MNTNLFTTTKIRAVVRATVAAAVGSLVAWGTTKWASLNSGSFAILAPAIASAYFAAIHFLEIKFPKLGWLLGLLPLAKTPAVVPAPVVEPTPTIEPTPSVAPTPAKATAPAKKAAGRPKKAVDKKTDN